MTKSQRNHRNTTTGKVSNVTTAKPVFLQKQSWSNEKQQQASDVK